VAFYWHSCCLCRCHVNWCCILFDIDSANVVRADVTHVSIVKSAHWKTGLKGDILVWKE
jgi:hypothetical protein